MKIHNDNEDQLTLAWTMDKLEPPQWEACVVVKGTFPLLGDGKGKWADESPKPQEPMGGLDEEGASAQPNDFAPVKLRGEYLVRATAYAPGGQPAPAFSASVEVGQLRKDINVFGYRVWGDSFFRRTISDPEPIDMMPIQWRYAFGGPNEPANPIGMGYGGGALPHLELPSQTVAQPRDHYTPAGLGPVPGDWEPRKSKRGTLKKNWLKTRWPWRPDDFQWDFYNEAPADQQIEGYFRGDEAIRLTNLHADYPQIETVLPGLAARLFVSFDEKDHQPTDIGEVRLKLDTVFIDAEEELLCVSWRGAMPARTMKLKEVSRVLIAHEPIASPRPASEYVERLRELARLEVEAFTFDLEGHMRKIEAMKASVGKKIADEKAAGEEEMANAQKLLDENEAQYRQEIQENIDRIDNAEARAKAQHAFDHPEAYQDFPPEAPDDQSKKSFEGLQGMGVNKMDKYEEFRAKEAEAKQTEAELLGQADAMVQAGEAKEAEIKANVGRGIYQAFAAEGMVPELAEGEPLPYAPGARLTREELIALVDQRVVLGLLNIEELDLTGIDFSGLDFRMVTFSACDLSGATFNRARLLMSNFNECVLEQTDFCGAHFERCHFSDSDLGSCVLDRIEAMQLTISECKASGVAWTGWTGQLISLSKLDLSGARIAEWKAKMVDLSKSTLTQSQWRDCVFEGIDFDEADVSESRFENCDVSNLRSGAKTSFVKTDFSGCRGEAPLFSQANCEGARFYRADFNRPAFSEANLVGADFSYAKLPRAAFNEADLTKASLVWANAIRASFQNAMLVQTDFAGANLYEAGFIDATVVAVDFSGANVRATLVDNYMRGKYPVAMNIADDD